MTPFFLSVLSLAVTCWNIEDILGGLSDCAETDDVGAE